MTSIKEANDITIMKLDELEGSLRKFEMGFKENETEKRKDIAFSVETTTKGINNMQHKQLLDSVALITKTFGRVMK